MSLQSWPKVEPYFYSVGHLRGTGIMAALFEVDDPYILPASELVERMLALGHVPVVRMRREAFSQYGHTTRVMRDGSTYLVAISRDAQLIGVQEVRTEPYPPE